jgi:hypothetical protein
MRDTPDRSFAVFGHGLRVAFGDRTPRPPPEGSKLFVLSVPESSEEVVLYRHVIARTAVGQGRPGPALAFCAAQQQAGQCARYDVGGARGHRPSPEEGKTSVAVLKRRHRSFQVQLNSCESRLTKTALLSRLTVSLIPPNVRS